ncbi:MAG: Mor transcription activator family protein [Vicinamibacterales bacterium]|uniref:Mor transcription activator family protein n=1 Tax=Ramlibacter sp. TaxID=1917967 RepID=UPI003D0F6C82
MKAWGELSIELLPKVLQDFVRLIGLHATMLLVDKFGGLRIYIPLNPAEDHHFAQLIGFDNLLKLSEVYGREDHFELPKAERALKAVRNAKIRAEFGPKSIRQLAHEHRLTERQVTRIVGAPTNHDQPELFG